MDTDGYGTQMTAGWDGGGMDTKGNITRTLLGDYVALVAGGNYYACIKVTFCFFIFVARRFEILRLLSLLSLKLEPL
jgi:hypothetical protein